jgi:hypothetical protein
MSCLDPKALFMQYDRGTVCLVEFHGNRHPLVPFG